MCGLWGGVGRTLDPGVIGMLALLNQSRGRDSTGVFAASGEYTKDDKSAELWLRSRENRDWIKNACAQSWAVCGHTRSSTRGKVCKDNAHPFLMGDILGSHNGVIWQAPNKYDVDSMYAFDLLAQGPPGLYQESLGEIQGGSYVLTYLDKRIKRLYFLNWTGSLYMTLLDGCMYYSSEAGHLHTATTEQPRLEVKSGDVFSYGEDLKMTTHQKYQGRAYVNDYQSRNNGHGYQSHYYNRQDVGTHTSTAQPQNMDFTASFSGDVLLVGPEGKTLWLGHRRNDVWSVLRCQAWLNAQHPKVKAPHIFHHAPAEIQRKEGEAKEEKMEEIALTEEEQREKLKQAGESIDGIEYAMSKA